MEERTDQVAQDFVHQQYSFKKPYPAPVIMASIKMFITASTDQQYSF